nr:hypothetical protein [Bacteroidota bacterium]
MWIDYAPDQNPDNDLLEISLEVIEGNSLVPGDIQTFDSWDECVAISICELYECPLYDGWMNLENEVHDASTGEPSMAPPPPVVRVRRLTILPEPMMGTISMLSLRDRASIKKPH